MLQLSWWSLVCTNRRASVSQQSPKLPLPLVGRFGCGDMAGTKDGRSKLLGDIILKHVAPLNSRILCWISRQRMLDPANASECTQQTPYSRMFYRLGHQGVKVRVSKDPSREQASFAIEF
jgi:hypothetical protein